MEKRKLIALITTNPESLYQQRVMEGVLAQCNVYGYDVAVVSTLVQIGHYYKDYLQGEVNIYNLINFDLVDGVVVTSISLSENGQSPVFQQVLDKINTECKSKVVALDMPFGDYDVVYTDDSVSFKEISKHIHEKHGCKKVYFLAGYKDNKSSEQRLKGFRDYYEENGLTLDENCIFYGDFWYSSGEVLAEKIKNKEVDMPEAVICASDHMALGLANKLRELDIRVPEDVIVTGFDATQESVINELTITSYEPNVAAAAAKAVNIIRKHLEPDKEVISIEESKHFGGLCIGESCGCPADFLYMKRKLNNALYNVNHNLVKELSNEESHDICLLLESYMYEHLVSARTPELCLHEIFRSTYLVHPFKEFFICLKENWLDMNDVIVSGYPEKIRIVVHSITESDDDNTNILAFSNLDTTGARSFETRLMLPEMIEHHDTASVYYYSPVHFNEELLGYTVMRCELTQKHKINYVFRNWVRYINNALEMMRIRNQLELNSTLDIATGLLNRRGMYQHLSETKKNSTGQDLLIIMADMDGLKIINDNFGHSEGDFGISTISHALMNSADKNEICVRNGGDEFLLIGIGKYTEFNIKEKIDNIQNEIKYKSDNSGKPYTVAASIGYYLTTLTKDTNFDLAISIADERMYQIKKQHHRNRV